MQDERHKVQTSDPTWAGHGVEDCKRHTIQPGDDVARSDSVPEYFDEDMGDQVQLRNHSTRLALANDCRVARTTKDPVPRCIRYGHEAGPSFPGLFGTLLP